jgi:glutamine synthetase type III
MSNYKAIKVNGKKMDEHRYIMEQYLGRQLARDEVVVSMNELRKVVDEIETRVDSKIWPIPTYVDLLFCEATSAFKIFTDVIFTIA